MSIRVLLADDHRIVREGLRALLEAQPNVEVVAEAEDGRMAVKLAEEMQPDVVIMDVGMPGLNGMEATRQILDRSPTIKVLALSMHSDRRFVLQMLSAGASGYLLKDCAFEELSRALPYMLSDQIYLSPRVAGVVVKDYMDHILKGAPATISSVILSTREREIIQLIAEGKSTREIALDLNVSTKTVETHRRRVMEKLDVRSIAELTKYAVREGLTSLEI